MNSITTFLRRNAARLVCLSLVSTLGVNLCGCLSMTAVDQARSRRFVDENGEVIRTEKGKPEMYCWLPLTVPVDAALLLVWGAWEGITHGSGSGDYSSTAPNKLKLSK